MDQLQLLADIDTWIVLATFWVAALFVPIVSLFWPWWPEPFGRATMSLELLIALALLPAALRRMFGISITNIGFAWFGTIILACIAPRIIWLGVSIWKLQRNGNRAEHFAEETDSLSTGTSHGTRRKDGNTR